jgi:K+/H+ antiporter YhaU regulatory subunit KhtT
VGQSLRDIDLRQRSGVTVIGIQTAGRTDTAEAASADRKLREGEALVVLGNLERLAALGKLKAEAAAQGSSDRGEQ